MTNAPSATDANGPLGAAILEARPKCCKSETSTSFTPINPQKPACQYQQLCRCPLPQDKFFHSHAIFNCTPRARPILFAALSVGFLAYFLKLQAGTHEHGDLAPTLRCPENSPGQGLFVRIGLVRQHKPLLDPPIRVNKHC